VTELAERTENGGHRARVAVYRKGMTHPFTRVGGCGHDEPMSRQGHGETMAFARACRRALRLAFPPDHVGLDGADLEPGDDGDTIHVVNEAAELAPEPPVSSYRPTTDDQRRARQILYARTEGEVAAFMTRHGIRDRGKAPFPADAVAELLEEPF
jgi:hypothetical protein